MTSRMHICCDSLMEASWLAAAVILPLFFNVSSARAFEPDKTYVLRFLAVISAAAWAAKKLGTKKSGRKGGAESKTSCSILGHTITVLVLSLAAIYALSSALSVMPVVSWWGSYQRAQGTITFFCYIVLFLAILSELRTPAQLKRLQYAIVVGSLPVILYAILQYFVSDPMLWANPVRGRPSGSMGNPIFLGAYLVMVIPLTFAGLAEAAGMGRSEDRGKAGIRLAAACGAILTLQLIALLCTQSRGPLIGLAAAGYICFFVFLVLKRSPGKATLPAWSASALLGFLAPVLVMVVIRIAQGFAAGVGLALIVAVLLLIAAAYFWFWRSRRGKQLLWLTWLAQTLVLAGFLAAGPDRILGEGTKGIPVLGRLAQLSDATVSVRLVLWQTGLRAVQSAAPADLIDGKRDSFHILRDAIGYGPECIGVAANRNAVPALARYHGRETIDRMHSDMFDNLLSIGLVGAIASLMVVAAAFFYSLRYLGFIRDSRRRNHFLIFSVLGSAAGIAVPWALGLPQLAGIGVQAGLLAGVFAFIARCGFGNIEHTLEGRETLALCVLAGLIAHFVETGVGIAVAPTRLCFFLLLAVLTVLASGSVKEEELPKHRSADTRWFRNPLMPYAAITSFLIFAESWCFVASIAEERNALLLFVRTWFSRPQEARFVLAGTILLFLLTVSGSLALMIGEMPDPRAANGRFWKIAGPGAGFMAFLWLAGGLLSAAFSTALDPMAALPINVALHAEARTVFFIAALMLLLIAAGLSLVAGQAAHYAAAQPVRVGVLWPCLLLSICAYAAIGELTVRPARADVARRIAGICESSVSAAAAVPVYERAAKLAPRVASYQIALGTARLHAGMSEKNPSRGESLLAAAEQSYRRAADLNPLDPAAYRALGSFYTQTGERISDRAARDARLRKALPFFRQAIQLAPLYANTYRELGRCHFLLREQRQARENYSKSLSLNPRSARTYIYMGEMQYWQKDLEQALQSFRQASSLSRSNLDARKNVGYVLEILGRKDEAIRAYLEALAQAPKDLTLLRRLASLYFGLGDIKAGMTYALRAYEVAPPAGKGSFDIFVEELKSN